MNDLTIPSTFRGFLPPYPVITPLSKEDMMFFLKLAMMPPEGVQEVLKADSFPLRVCLKRLNAYGIQFCPKLLILLIDGARNPAHAVVIAYTLALIDAAGDGQMEFGDVCMKYFPEGLPDMSKFKDLWESQKVNDQQREMLGVGTDNLLDVAPWPKREAVSA